MISRASSGRGTRCPLSIIESAPCVIPSAAASSCCVAFTLSRYASIELNDFRFTKSNVSPERILLQQIFSRLASFLWGGRTVIAQSDKLTRVSASNGLRVVLRNAEVRSSILLPSTKQISEFPQKHERPAHPKMSGRSALCRLVPLRSAIPLPHFPAAETSAAPAGHPRLFIGSPAQWPRYQRPESVTATRGHQLLDALTNRQFRRTGRAFVSSEQALAQPQ